MLPSVPGRCFFDLHLAASTEWSFQPEGSLCTAVVMNGFYTQHFPAVLTEAVQYCHRAVSLDFLLLPVGAVDSRIAITRQV